MATSYAPNIVSDGLVACWDAAGKRSYPGTGTTWTDVVAGYIGTLYKFEAGFFDSANGGSLDFDGTDSYVRTPAPSPDGTGGFAIEFWAKFDDASNTDCMFANYTVDKCQIVIRHENDFRVQLGGSAAVDYDDLEVTSGIWYCMLISRIGSTLKGYIDGVEIFSVSNSTDLATSGDSYFGIQHYGGDPGSVDHPFDGEMAIMRWYNRGLTDAEVLQNYNALKWRFQ